MGEGGGDRRRIVVEPGAGGRLDAYLTTRLPELSRSRITHLLAEGRILVNGKRPRKSQHPTAGDVIDVVIPPPEPWHIEPEALSLHIVYEDDDVVVVNKEAGMVVHPGAGNRAGTLVNALLHHVADLSGIGGVLRPGVVHRLDKDTSGLLLVAKHDRAHRRLAAALKAREIQRRYLVAAWGHLEEATLVVDAPLGRSPRHRQRMAVVPEGRRAVTRFQRLERWRAAELLQADLETGRTHQIRVHLVHVGHPVVGDRTYGSGAERGMSGPARGWARELAAMVPRQFLHAAELRFHHPMTGEELAFRSPLPEDLAPVATWARATSSSG